MFNKSNFCHIASNNRNDQKGSVFIYKTTDTLAQVTQSGYFNEKLIDINVHDLIIHVQYDPVARTLKKSVLIVTERTMDNVETAPISDQTIVENIDQLGDQIDRLGNQVVSIEKKIPKNASAQNQLATKSEIPTVPANISAFNNDSGYITSSALTPYATTQALNDGLATKQPAGDYATNSALTSGLALKVAIAQGAENAGKILKIDDSGNVIVADESVGASLPILANIWSDHLLNDVSWLRADTFSWQSGDVYTAAYEHLVADYENATTGYSWTGDTTGNIYITKGMPSVGDTVVGGGYTVGEVSSLGITVYKNGSPYETATLKSAVSGINTSQNETIGDITITYYLSDDGHKICLPDQESNIVALYEATGVAWYYILDTTNRQFKLPRTKWGFTGLRDSVGGYVAQDVLLPNITGVVTGLGDVSVSGAFARGSKVAGNGGGDGSVTADSFDASRSSSVYSGNGTNTLIQPRATQMYLYFYVGNFEQSAIEQTAGLNAELFNGKADRNLLNTTDNVDIVVESQMPTADGYTWYRKYKSGWVEQGGIKLQNTDSKQDLSLPIEMNGSTYSVLTSVMDDNLSNFVFCVKVTDKTTTGFKTTVWASYQQGTSTGGYNFVWQVSGMSAQ